MSNSPPRNPWDHVLKEAQGFRSHLKRKRTEYQNTQCKGIYEGTEWESVEDQAERLLRLKDIDEDRARKTRRLYLDSIGPYSVAALPRLMRLPLSKSQAQTPSNAGSQSEDEGERGDEDDNTAHHGEGVTSDTVSNGKNSRPTRKRKPVNYSDFPHGNPQQDPSLDANGEPNPSRPVNRRDKFFHTLNNPSHIISNYDGVQAEYCNKILFDENDWKHISIRDRPRNIPLRDWPPTSKEMLLRVTGEKVRDYEQCAGKFCWGRKQDHNGERCDNNELVSAQEKTAAIECGHTLDEWLSGGEGWENLFELKDTTDGRGVGAYAKRDFEKDTILGAYTGKLLPTKQLSGYAQQIEVGPQLYSKGTELPHFYIDAAEYGNWTRFINHHCSAFNAKFFQLRVGATRMLTAVTTSKIKKGEEILVSYGAQYFTESGLICKCGSDKCVSKKQISQQPQPDEHNGPPESNIESNGDNEGHRHGNENQGDQTGRKSSGKGRRDKPRSKQSKQGKSRKR